RTALSPGIREQHDEFPLIADPQGRMVVGQFGSFIHGFLERYEGTIEEGDVFLLNDPYACAGAISHLNDWLVLMPLYHEGRLVGWASMFGHMTDVGGAVPGSMPIDARTIHSEGVIIRPFKLYARGVLDESGLDFILHQVRLPEWNRSDLMGIVAACRLAERRVRELCDRFGRDVYLATLDALLDRNYRAIKELIRRNIPETPQSFEDWVDDDGTGFGPYRVKCTVWREGDRAVFDWSGTDPQSPAAINFYLNPEMLKMFVGVYLIMVFDPQILFNDGFYPLIDVRIPEGSLLNPRYPAALSGRTHALGRVFDVFGGALGKQTPEFMNGAGFSDSPHLMYSGYDSRGEWFQLYQIGFGGVPGRPIGDGLDGHSLWPEFTNVPNEYLESYYPLVMERYECVPDSGGAGKHRGGCGMDVVYRFLADGEISIHDDRWLTYPWGVLGGKPGARSTKYLVKPDGRRIILPSKGDHLRVERGDVLHFVTWGGGGWGDPLERDPERVLLDVRRGFVTVESARA
ncbi:MAG TPA: hydantoinase B/oxoprolinase family protein, partial [Planctomycetaceae bacterium]